MRTLQAFLIASSITFVAMAHAEEPKIVKDAAASAEWVSKALSTSGYKADFSLDSLKEIDRFFDDQAPLGKPKANGLLSQDLGARLFAIGSYVGEVVRRRAGGSWQGNDTDPQAEINIALKLPSGKVMWPVQRVMKRFKLGPEESVYAYGAVATSP